MAMIRFHTCDHCGKQLDDKKNKVRSDYCPNCGADMRGKEE